MNESQFEDIITKYPELIENGLILIARQINVKGKFIDILFKDRHGTNLIIELKKGTIVREHIGQLMDYEGHLLSPDDPTVRVMLVGNRVPNNLRRALDHHGFEWKELKISDLIEFLNQKEDTQLLCIFKSEELEKKPTKKNTHNPLVSSATNSGKTIWDKISSIFGNNFIGDTLSRAKIIDKVIEEYPGTNRTSVLPSDYCYNITNKGISFKKYLFEYLEDADYKVFGLNYDYTGPIYWTNKQGEKKQVGEWRKGEKEPRFWEDIY